MTTPPRATPSLAAVLGLPARLERMAHRHRRSIRRDAPITTIRYDEGLADGLDLAARTILRVLRPELADQLPELPDEK